MGLNLALNTARSSLSATATQIALASRNTAGANDPGYTRKVGALVTAGGGSIVVIQRAADAALFTRTLTGASAAASSEALLTGIESLSATVGDTDDATSPAARLGAFNAAFAGAVNRPDGAAFARAAVDSARDLAASLNEAATTIHTVRADADDAMAASVDKINDLLGQFDLANTAVKRAAATGADAGDALDSRDRILASLSEEIGITTLARAGSDLAIYTDSGVPLYDRAARTVSFTPTDAYSAGTSGAAVIVDGVPVTGDASPMPLRSGRLAGLSDLRDVVSVQYETQLDAIAGSLVDAFAETGTVAGVPTTLAGLFTAGAANQVPLGSPFLQTGFAGSIRINAAVDPRQPTGDLNLLRDGGMNGAAFRSNPGSAAANAGYPDRLREMKAALGAERSFDASTDLPGQATLLAFASSSAGWIENSRKAATADADYQATLLSRASEAYSNASGVNVDDEAARTLQLEQSYNASAKLLALVNDLLKSLMDAVR